MTGLRRLPGRVLRATRTLRFRLMAGAGLLAVLAIFGASLAAYGAYEAARRTQDAIDAQYRMELLAALSGRVSDYAVIAVEANASAMPDADRKARLREREAIVRDAFAAIGRALASNVAAADGDEASRRATQSIGLARMNAQFDALVRGLDTTGAAPTGPALRAALDGFATRFSPILNEAIEEERRTRDLATRRISALRPWLTGLAAVTAVAAPLILLLLHAGLVRPLLARLDRMGQATAAIGRESFDVRLPVSGRDELARLFARVNQMSARLARRRARVDADRARLEDLVAERTAALQAANDRLARVDVDRRRFFADVGHELRTPLTVILAETELGQSATDEERRTALTVIRARAQRLNRRIDDLLRIARSETGQIELHKSVHDLGRLAALAIDDLGPLLKRHRIAVERDLAPGLAVECDADWLRQVIGGLIENAVKYRGTGQGIAVTVRTSDDMAEVRITDEGPGIAAADQARVFGRFERGGQTGAGGFGVGLALARWIVEDHGGRVALRSPVRDGRGTAVSLCLPLVLAPVMD